MLYSQFLLSILYIVVCMHQSQYPNLSLLPYPLVIISLFSTSVILLLFCKQVHLCPFFCIPYMKDIVIFVFLINSRSMLILQYNNSSLLLKMALFHSFMVVQNSTGYVYHIFIHPSVDGHLGCFLLAIVNSAAVNTGVKVSF